MILQALAGDELVFDISAALLLTDCYIAGDYLCYPQVMKCIIVTEKSLLRYLIAL